MRYTFIEAEEARYPVRVLCRCLEVSAAGYYGWRTAGPSRREQEDERLGVEVAAIFQENRRRYGSPRVHGELRDRGRCVSRKRVARLLSERGLRARSGRRKAPRTLVAHAATEHAMVDDEGRPRRIAREERDALRRLCGARGSGFTSSASST